ncbi:MAG: tRNA (cytidine(34)-2'-O)-methyltransferase [Kiritimatiellia bacterium]
MTEKPCHDTGFRWPEPPLKIVLVEPEIPPNTGNIARLCAGTGSELHLIEPLGFQLTESAIRRAGLDYWKYAQIFRHKSFSSFEQDAKPSRMFFFTTQGPRVYTDIAYEPGDALVFGSETKGLPADILSAHAGERVCLPMKDSRVRSQNLANAAAIVLYEALRQINLRGI